MVKPRSDLVGIVCAIGTAVVFGANPPAMRAVYAHGGDVVFVILITVWARALALAGYCLMTRKSLFQTRVDTQQAITGGFFQALTVSGAAAALVFLQGPIVAVIVYTYALMLLFYTSFHGETKLTIATLLTTLTAFAGLTLVLDVWHTHQLMLSWVGIVCAFIAALATASRIYVFGQLTQRRDPMIVGAECLLFTAIFCSLILFFKLPHAPISFAGYGWVCVCCLSVAVGSFSMFFGISHLGSFRWGLFSKIEPIFTSLFSIWFLNEILKWQQYAGILLVIVSLAVYQIVDHRRHAVNLHV